MFVTCKLSVKVFKHPANPVDPAKIASIFLTQFVSKDSGTLAWLSPDYLLVAKRFTHSYFVNNNQQSLAEIWHMRLNNVNSKKIADICKSNCIFEHLPLLLQNFTYVRFGRYVVV